LGLNHISHNTRPGLTPSPNLDSTRQEYSKDPEGMKKLMEEYKDKIV